MIELILILILTVALFLAPAFFIRWLAGLPFYWTFQSANTFSLIVTKDEESAKETTGGGNVVDALHAIPGKWMDKSSLNPMDWEMKDLAEGEEDPDHNYWLYPLLGTQSMGSIFHTKRTNLDRRLRYAREENGESFHALSKDKLAQNVFYSGEQTVKIEESDTADKLGLWIEIDLIFERVYPVRSILRLADPTAYLTSMVEEIVNNLTGIKEASAYIGGEGTEDNKQELANAIQTGVALKKEILEQLGLQITSVNLRKVTMPPKQRELLELEVEARKKAEAKVITAEGDKKAGILLNDRDADRIERVIKPAAESERTVAVRAWEAYENNKTVTVFAPGSETMVPLQK